MCPAQDTNCNNEDPEESLNPAKNRPNLRIAFICILFMENSKTQRIQPMHPSEVGYLERCVVTSLKLSDSHWSRKLTSQSFLKTYKACLRKHQLQRRAATDRHLRQTTCEFCSMNTGSLGGKETGSRCQRFLFPLCDSQFFSFFICVRLGILVPI